MLPDGLAHILPRQIHSLNAVLSVAHSDLQVFQQRDHPSPIRRVHTRPQNCQGHCAVDGPRVYIQKPQFFSQFPGQCAFSCPGRAVNGNAFKTHVDRSVLAS